MFSHPKPSPAANSASSTPASPEITENFADLVNYPSDRSDDSDMNIKPGGKQARMHNGWYIRDGIKISQPLIYPSNHPYHPDTPKGIKTTLIERGLWQQQL
jgi:hypothetical protein